ncbi:MAG: STAS domain-containing protein [Burkholderiaceae bacterium]
MDFRPAPSLTVDNAREMLCVGLQAIAAGQRVIDCAGLATVDSAAVAVLLAWQRAAIDQSVMLSFVNQPEMLRSLATLYGVTTLLTAL